MKNRPSQEEIRGIAAKAASTLLSYPWKVWFWGDSIGLEGLLNATELTGDAQYRGFVYGLFKAWIAREKFRSEFDYTAAGVALLQLYEQTRDEELLAAAERHSAYMAGFRKTDTGAAIRYENAAFELPPELPPDHADFKAWRELADRVKNGGPCIFVDSMHFDAPFYAALYRVTEKDEYNRLAIETALSQIHLLFDPKDGLFHHFWIEQTHQRNGVAWGRGNGWGLLGLVDTLENLPPDDSGVREIREVLCRVLERMAELQDASGGWHTVVTDPTSYIETSVAAFMINVMSRAILRSWVRHEKYRPVVEMAWAFMLEHIRHDGVLDGVSYETFPSTRVEHYRRMPRGGIVPWGQGPLLSALWAYARLRRSFDSHDKVVKQAVSDASR
jgi:unsaturated rhamnogalacturonyl hydrolase